MSAFPDRRKRVYQQDVIGQIAPGELIFGLPAFGGGVEETDVAVFVDLNSVEHEATHGVVVLVELEDRNTHQAKRKRRELTWGWALGIFAWGVVVGSLFAYFPRLVG